jgi:primosomal protein N'
MDFSLNGGNLIISKEKGKYEVSFLLKINSQKQNLEQIKENLFLPISKNKIPKVKLKIDVEPIKCY